MLVLGSGPSAGGPEPVAKTPTLGPASADVALVVDPTGARRAALAAPKKDALWAAETLVLIGDGQGALDVLRHASVDQGSPRTIRLVADALGLLGDERALRAAAIRLQQHGAWRTRAEAATTTAVRIKRTRLVERIGLGLFALALALLGLGGARALLQLRWPTMWMAVFTLGAVLLIRSVVPRAVPLFALLGVGFATLVHAGASTADRTRPDARGRTLIVALILLGAVGLVLGTTASLSMSGLLAVIAAR